MRLSGHGITVDLPDRWEGRIHTPPSSQRPPAGRQRPSPDGERTFPVAHLANFPLPELRGDFGSGAVEGIHSGDVFVALVEYAAAEADTNLFAPRGLPRRLDTGMFSARSLQRTLPGHVGLQEFLTTRGRAFSLYVVIGCADDLPASVRRVEEVLGRVRIERPS